MRSAALLAAAILLSSIAYADSTYDEARAWCHDKLDGYAQDACLRKAANELAARKAEIERPARERAAAKAKARAEQAAREAKARDARLAPQREALANAYLSLMRELFPRYNYMSRSLKRIRGGYALYAHHPAFTDLTFMIGPQGPRVEHWVHTRASELLAADIKRVGLQFHDGSSFTYSPR